MISLIKLRNANKKSKFINILIYALLVIETLAFVILPFIKSEKVIWKIILFTIWGLVSLELIFELVYYLVDRTYLQKRDKPIKDKGEHVLFWITFSAYIIALISIFLGAFLIQNFGAKISLGNYVFIVATILIVLGIAFLIVSHRKNLLEFFKIISIIALSVIAVVFLLSGIIAKETNEMGSKVLICIGAGALIFILSSIFIKVFLKLSESKILVKDVGLIVLVFVLLAILSSVLIIYVIPEDNHNVFTTIISAVLGGVVTFLGVVWTIKKQDRDRREEEKKKAKPIFAIKKVNDISIDKNISIIDFETDDKVRFPCYALAVLENSNQSVFTVEGISYDLKKWKAKSNKTVLPNSKNYLKFYFEEMNSVVYLDIRDALGEVFTYVLQLEMQGKVISKDGLFHTVVATREIRIEDL